MIILIGAVSSTGKTVMAQNLLEKYKIPYYSIDHIKMGLFRSGTDYGFHPEDNDRHISLKLWPIVKGIIMTAIENKQDLILEGCYILPKLLKDIPEEYQKDIININFGFSDDYIRNNFETGIIRNRDIIEDRGKIEDRRIEYFIKAHNELKKECIEYDAYYYEIKDNYNDEIMKIYEYINTQINEKKYNKYYTI